MHLFEAIIDANHRAVAGDGSTAVQAPLTVGFARTGHELEQIELREQKMDFEREQEGKK